MLTGAPLSRFRKNLLAWFAQFQRDMPWRRTLDPYRIWLSEIMLQQTRVAAAIPYYERFLQRFPTVEALACAPRKKCSAYGQDLATIRGPVICKKPLKQ
jgi:A/G-specific adenine glycosylase